MPTNQLNTEPLLTAKQIAKRLGVKTGFLYSRTSGERGDIPFIKIGKLVRFRWSEICAWLQRGHY